jgi:hypothetical protein
MAPPKKPVTPFINKQLLASVNRDILAPSDFRLPVVVTQEGNNCWAAALESLYLSTLHRPTGTQEFELKSTWPWTALNQRQIVELAQSAEDKLLADSASDPKADASTLSEQQKDRRRRVNTLVANEVRSRTARHPSKPPGPAEIDDIRKQADDQVANSYKYLAREANGDRQAIRIDPRLNERGDEIFDITRLQIFLKDQMGLQQVAQYPADKIMDRLVTWIRDEKKVPWLLFSLPHSVNPTWRRQLDPGKKTYGFSWHALVIWEVWQVTLKDGKGTKDEHWIVTMNPMNSDVHKAVYDFLEFGSLKEKNHVGHEIGMTTDPATLHLADKDEWFYIAGVVDMNASFAGRAAGLPP